MSNISYINEELREIAAHLPPEYDTHWTNARRVAVVRAVQSGVISLERALAVYRMSRAEFETWRRCCTPLGQNYAGLPHMHASPQVARRDPLVRPLL